ncbi:putative yir4 protein [Plasmodium yoelii yoelii]|uniref:Yir4 protein n=1 Tax=Plasmodium yoelii yoelii TaxID=73239 RepID=Q7RA21_PLAYO|nr:putative yir4 protein [Plasmodium yoelii yoelii]
MDKQLCEKFDNVWEDFLNRLTADGKYQFKDKTFLNSYCDVDKCDSDIEKINAGFFYLLNQFFGSSVLSHYGKNNINIVDYIILWLSYMLTLKENPLKNGMKYFYTTFINSNAKYKMTVENVEDCHTFKDIIEKRHNLMNDDMDKNSISTLHDAFKLLCKMYTDFNEDTSNCKKCSENAKKFVEKYKKLNGDPNNTNGSSYNKMLSTLSTDYNKLKDKCNNTLPFPSIETIQNSELTSAQTSEVASSSSSISKNIFTVLSIFVFVIWISETISKTIFKTKNKKNKEENESLICDSNSSDCSRNSNND